MLEFINHMTEFSSFSALFTSFWHGKTFFFIKSLFSYSKGKSFTTLPAFKSQVLWWGAFEILLQYTFSFVDCNFMNWLIILQCLNNRLDRSSYFFIFNVFPCF